MQRRRQLLKPLYQAGQASIPGQRQTHRLLPGGLQFGDAQAGQMRGGALAPVGCERCLGHALEQFAQQRIDVKDHHFSRQMRPVPGVQVHRAIIDGRPHPRPMGYAGGNPCRAGRRQQTEQIRRLGVDAHAALAGEQRRPAERSTSPWRVNSTCPMRC
ncbi:hypothetical protein D3C76_1052290 [compost metagenome]